MPQYHQIYDIAVIGAGIAGASAAAELALAGKYVVLIEQESHPGYHTTGRSAAVYSPIYGPQAIRALTRASLDFYENPPEGFAQTPLLSPIGVAFVAFVAREDQLGKLEAMQNELVDATTVRRLEQDALEQRLGLLRKGYAAGGLLDAGTSEIDVAALHQGYLRQFKSQGGKLMMRAPVTALTCNGDVWEVATAQGSLAAYTVINASGAWAETVGQLTGAEHIGLVPKRRTALMVDAPDGFDTRGLPLIVDVEEQFYLKPDAGKLLISPANEDPEAPCDVQPDEMDIAVCVDRIERAFDISIAKIDSPWAGLRSFVADKSPVAGFSQKQPGFYWLAGQGGYGIQSAPALAKYVAAEVTGQPVPSHILNERLDPQTIRPGRAGVGI